VSSEGPITIPPSPAGAQPPDPDLERHLEAREKGRSCLRVVFISLLVALAVVAIAAGGCFLLVFTLK
jgi:hypothetical protein